MARFIALLALLLLPLFGGAASIFDQLKQTDVHTATEASLTFPVDSLMARSGATHKAEFVFVGADGRPQTWSVKVSTRGKFRRVRCDMPPLKLDFSKKDLAAAGLSRHDKYKLVVPCFEDLAAEALVYKEYLAYRAYELLTPYSFRTQMLRLKLHDSNGGPDHTIMAFLIEDTDEMAERNGAVEIDTLLGQVSDRYNPEAEAIHALFQYLIGNGDWSMLLKRNVKVIYKNDEFIPVGYDFDFTGWVGSPYASANSNIGQTSIYERVYLGYAQSDEVVAAVIDRFRAQRRPIMKLISSAPLPAETTLTTQRFAARFFSFINRLSGTEELTIYDQLRGETAAYIPIGESVDSYRSTGK